MSQTAETKETQSEQKPWEVNLQKDHPELFPIKKEPTDRKAEFEKNLEEVVAPKEESKEEEQPADPEVKPPAEETEEPAKEEAQPDPASEDKAGPVKAEVEKTEDAIKAYADENKLTIDEAKEELSQNDAILKKYGGNPQKLAKAYRNMQREYDKQKSDILRTQQAEVVNRIMIDPDKFVADAEAKHKDAWIAEYRKVFPAKSELMSDEAILEEQRANAKGKIMQQINEYQGRLSKEAGSRREDFIKSIPANMREYSSDIAQVLKRIPDQQLMSADFNFTDILRWARGSDNAMDKLIKEAEERGYKKAMDEKRILGEASVAKPQNKTTVKTPTTRSSGEQLSNYEKKQAVERFGSAYDNPEDCYKAYVEVFKSRDKKK